MKGDATVAPRGPRLPAKAAMKLRGRTHARGCRPDRSNRGRMSLSRGCCARSRRGARRMRYGVRRRRRARARPSARLGRPDQKPPAARRAPSASPTRPARIDGAPLPASDLMVPFVRARVVASVSSLPSTVFAPVFGVRSRQARCLEFRIPHFVGPLPFRVRSDQRARARPRGGFGFRAAPPRFRPRALAGARRARADI